MNQINNFFSFKSRDYYFKIEKFLAKPLAQFFFFFILIFLVLSPVLIAGQFFFQSDSFNGSYPDLSFYQEALKNNESFLWNPYVLSGFPNFLILGGGYLSPIFYFFLRFFNFLSAYNWLIFFDLVLAGFLTTRLSIHFKVLTVPALVAGIAYVLGSYILLTDLSVINYLPFLPGVIWLLVICYEKNKWWPVFVGFLTVYLVLVSVHFNWQLIIFANGAIFSLFYPWLKKEVSFKKYLVLVAKYLVMLLGGFLLASPFIFSLFSYLPYSYRGGGLGYGEAIAGSTQILDFVGFILPYFNPPLFASGTQFYLGILPLFFLVFSFAFFRQERLVKFFSLIFIFCLLIAVKYSPIFWLMQKLPFISSFRGPSRWMALGLFAGSILAGIGAENFLKTDFEKFRTKLIKLFKWATFLIIFFSLFFNLINYFFSGKILEQIKNYFNSHLYAKTTGLPIEHYYQVIAQIYNNFFNLINFANPKFFCPLLILIFSYLTIIFFQKYKKFQSYFFPSILFVVIINFLLVLPLAYQSAPRQILSYRPRIANYISNNPGKVFTFLPGFSEFDRLSTGRKPTPFDTFVFQSELLVPNINTFYKIKSADGYNSLMSRRHAEILALIGSDRAVAGEKLADLRIPLADKIELFRQRLNLVNLLGIKYIISAYPIEDERLDNVLMIEATDYKIPLYLYQNKNSLPEIYFANEVFLALKKEEENYNMIIKPENDFNKMTFIECSNCQKTEKPLDSSIKVIEEKNGYLEAKVSNQNSGWLIFNQSNLPGWQAEIDNSVVPIYTANYIFQAVFIPAGNHKIIFQYNPLANLKL